MKGIFGFIRTLAVGIALGAAIYAYAPEFLRTGSAEPPGNFVAVSERIHTSGQPSAAQLGGLKDKATGLSSTSLCPRPRAPFPTKACSSLGRESAT